MSVEENMLARLGAEKILGLGDDEEFNRKIARPWRDSAFRPEDFSGRVYPRDEVEADEEKIRRIKKSSDYTHEKSSEAVDLEYVLMEGIKVHGWFGDDVESVQKTSEYDDAINGTDFVVTFRDEDTGEFVYLAIDATTSADPSVIRRKADKVYEKLNRAKMTEIKYFEDPDGKAGKVEMPRIVLALNPKKTVVLQKLIVGELSLAEDAREKFDFLASTEEQLLRFINHILFRARLLGEGRELKNFDDVSRFFREHEDEMGGRIGEIVSKHLEVLSFVVEARKKKDSPKN